MRLTEKNPKMPVVSTPNGSSSSENADLNKTHTPSQRYLSTRGGSYGLSFEDTVLKGLATDGGLFIPEEIPSLPCNWESKWGGLSFQDLALEILSLYISPSEIPREDLKDIIIRSYSSFRVPEITPLVTLDKSKKLHLLELFHGPTFAFKDVALQLLGNLFEYFLRRKNRENPSQKRHHLTVVGATSGDTGSAAIYGLRAKKDVSVIILHPIGRISPIQEAQMTSVLDDNVHNLAVHGTFDDCQDIVKALFADHKINQSLNLGAVNSINWARILAQSTYYFQAYFLLIKSSTYQPGQKIKFIVPTGNFGDILAGYFAKRMGLPLEKLVVATNENDILDRFWKTGKYEKNTSDNSEGQNTTDDEVKVHDNRVKETLSPAMDILVSSNFERLLWFLAYEYAAGANMDEEWNKKQAGQEVEMWLRKLKIHGGFEVPIDILKSAKKDFESERISDSLTLQTIKEFYSPVKDNVEHSGTKSYILDPHSAIGVAASLLSIQRDPSTDIHYIALATAHPAKFSHAVQLALQSEKGFNFNSLLPEEFLGLTEKEKKLRIVPENAGWEGIRQIIQEEIDDEFRAMKNKN